MYGTGGLLSGDGGLTFRDGVLVTPKLGGFTAVGEVDFAKQAMKNVKINSGTITGISEFETEHLKARGGMDIAKDATIGGSLTVSGSVMGSGAYTDISDVRFKRDVVSIGSADALRTIRALRGVSYVLDVDAFPGRGFDGSAQIGFIAQEVEAVLPELVQTTPSPTPIVNLTAANERRANANASATNATSAEAGGVDDLNQIKSVAYARAVPLLVEAVKEIDRRLDQRVGDEQQERQQLSKKIEQLQAGANRSADCACESKVASLEQKVRAQAAELTELKEEQQRMRGGQQAAMADATRLMQEQVQKQVQEQLKQALGHLRDDIFGESKA
jgi:hypothetical protein